MRTLTSFKRNEVVDKNNNPASGHEITNYFQDKKNHEDVMSMSWTFCSIQQTKKSPNDEGKIFRDFEDEIQRWQSKLQLLQVLR